MSLIKDLLEIKDFGHWMNDATRGDESPAVSSSETEYEGSVDFTEDFHAASKKLDEAYKVFTSEKFRKWVEATDRNFPTQTEHYLDKITDAIRDAIGAVNDFDEELEDAQ